MLNLYCISSLLWFCFLSSLLQLNCCSSSICSMLSSGTKPNQTTRVVKSIYGIQKNLFANILRRVNPFEKSIACLDWKTQRYVTMYILKVPKNKNLLYTLIIFPPPAERKLVIYTVWIYIRIHMLCH